MVFSSTIFLCVYLPAVLGLYYICPEKLKNGFLLFASLVFYAWGEPVYVLLMVFSIAVNYVFGLLMEKKAEKKKLWLIISVIIDLGLLCLFKYTDFIIENINGAFDAGLDLLKLALPIGISFYTFQAMSYTIDVYRGNVRAQKNIVDFGMYITMFPQLIAGPIVRYTDVEAQLKNRRVSAKDFSDGISRFIVGLGKKVLLANQIGALWSEVYALGGNTSALMAWIGAFAFSFQIYFDFSGYSDMAIGLGKMLGFEFVQNFDYPYISRSATEFWRRWHISLGTWFREYVYIPLGGNRVGPLKHIRNIMIVWLLTGFWHGAAWCFILWGLYYGILLLLEKYIWGKGLAKLPKFIQHIYTIIIFYHILG